MRDFINNVYFDKVRYVLSNLSKFELSSDEILVVLTILILKEQNKIVTLEGLSQELGMTSKEVDDVLTLLTSKRYLEIKIVDSHVDFNVDKLFDIQQEVSGDVHDIFKLFEEEFSRTFNQKELVRLNEWMRHYHQDELVDALRSASIMNKLDLNYIQKILENNRNESK